MNNIASIILTNSSGSTTDIAVASTAVVYTKALPLKYIDSFGLFIKATSDGVVNAKVELEQSYKKPAAEGVADANWVTPEGGNIILTTTDENAHVVTISDMKVMPFFRLKITGLGSNDVSMTISLILGIAENL